MTLKIFVHIYCLRNKWRAYSAKKGDQEGPQLFLEITYIQVERSAVNQEFFNHIFSRRCKHHK